MLSFFLIKNLPKNNGKDFRVIRFLITFTTIH
jgi:hypothetical protein